MPQPLVTVVVPTHNRADLLPRAVGSVLTQTHTNLELIIVDDGSTDQTAAVVQRLEDPRVRYMRFAENRGACAARNAGVAAASGAFINFLDSDDLLYPHAIESLLKGFQSNPRSSVVYSGWEWVDERSERVLKIRRPGTNGRIQGLPRWAFNVVPDMLFRSQVLEHYRYDPEYRIYEHFDVILRVSKDHEIFAVQDVVVRCYKHQGARLSDELSTAADLMARLITLHGDFIRQDTAAWAHFNRTAGALYLGQTNEQQKARKYFRSLLAVRPFWWKSWAYLARAHRPSIIGG